MRLKILNEIAKDFFRKVHVSDEFAYAVFASQNIVELIMKYIPEHRRKYLMDATFRIVPYGEFKQLLVIHIEYIEMVILNILKYFKIHITNNFYRLFRLFLS